MLISVMGSVYAVGDLSIQWERLLRATFGRPLGHVAAARPVATCNGAPIGMRNGAPI